MPAFKTMILAAIICTAFGLQSTAQVHQSRPLQLRFVPVLNGSSLILDAEDSGNTRISTFRCYISGISLWQNNQLVWQERDSYHLLDAAEPASLQLHLGLPANLNYNTIRFNLGIDSATSSSGAHGGDLDPAKGMYWAWQSGYINFKLEGSNPACPTRKHAFHFHLGGYQYPYVAIQPVSLTVKPADTFLVKMDLSRFLSGMDLSKQHSIMIPGAEAYQLSTKAVGIFSIQP